MIKDSSDLLMNCELLILMPEHMHTEAQTKKNQLNALHPSRGTLRKHMEKEDFLSFMH